MPIKITVKTLDSHDYQFEAERDWTVLQFKEHIQDVVNVPSSEQRLIFLGRVLQNTNKISDYDCDGKVMHLVRRPPPTLGSSDHNSSDDRQSAETNDGTNRTDESARDVFLSAFTQGTNETIQEFTRQMMSVQQSVYNRTFGNATISGQNRSNSDIELRLNSLTRLTALAEAQVRMVTERVSSQANQTSDRAPTCHPVSSTNLDMINNTCASTSSTEHRSNTEQTQQSGRLPSTTGDLPQPSSMESSNQANETPSMTARPVRSFDRYMTLLNRYSVLQAQFQNILTRYQEALAISREGASTEIENDAAGQAPQSTGDSSTNLPSQYGQFLSSNIPRIMHTFAHIQHTLSDFSVDVTEASLRVLSHAAPADTSVTGLSARESNPSSNRTQNDERDRSTSETNVAPVIENSVIITATTVETTPVLSTSTTTSNLQPQTSATIVVTSEPGQTGVHIPISIPLRGYNPQDFHLNISTSGLPNSDQGQSHEPDRAEQRDSNQSNTARSNQSRRQETTSTQTSHTRPISLISGRMPPLFDYYLMCCSPHTENHGHTNEQPMFRQPEARLQFRLPRARTVSSGTAPFREPNEQTNQPNANLNAGLTEVVNNILESIFRPAEQVSTQQSTDGTHRSNQSTPINQDPIFNMIPDLAINAATQILGAYGIFGRPTQQDQQHQPETAQTPRSQVPVMMDIDIDDSSSSHSDSRYHDANDTNRPSQSRAHLSEQPSTSRHAPSSGATTTTDHSIRNPARSLLENNNSVLLQLARKHPDWLPIIESDTDRMYNGLSRTPSYFSDAYLNSMPRKKRRVLIATPDRVSILHPAAPAAITNLLRRCATSSDVSSSDVQSLEAVFKEIAEDSEIQSAYEDHLKSTVEARLKTDEDFEPKRYENSNKYFNYRS